MPKDAKLFCIPLIGLLVAFVPGVLIRPVNYIAEDLMGIHYTHLSTGVLWALSFMALVALYDLLLIAKYSDNVLTNRPLHLIIGIFLLHVAATLYQLGLY